MSLANRIWPGGTSPKSVRWSSVLHHAVSKKRLGWSAAWRQIQAEVADAVVGEDQPEARVAAGDLEGVAAERRDAAAGVDHDRQPTLVGQREHALEALVAQPEPSARG